jgi:hypothetical protein
MIITRLIGGLGNQLFQYAIARNLAFIHKTNVKVDITPFETYKLHEYSLKPLNIKESIASPKDVSSLKNPTMKERIKAKIRRRMPVPPASYIREKHYHFDPDILDLPNNIYLEGYWQTPKYFFDILDTLREEFNPHTVPGGKDLDILNKIKNSYSISIHMRRGDYVKNPKTQEYHGVCDIDYYKRCIRLLADKVQNPHFFLFSDDPKWCEENLHTNYRLTAVSHNDAKKNYEDLRLMSNCSHQIIANSSFSWWAAMLNKNPAKIVCSPQNWFKNSKNDIKDLLPETWIRI